MLKKLHIQMFAGEGVTAGTNSAETNGQAETNDSLATNEANPPEESFDAIRNGKYKKEIDDLLEKTVKKRLSGTNKKLDDANQRFNMIAPALEKFAMKYGISDPNNIEAIIAEIDKDNSFYESYAYEHGISTDQARTILQAEQILKQEEARKKNEINEQIFRDKMNKWSIEGEQLKSIYPNFDFQLESQNQEFMNLLYVGYSVQDTYEFVHRKELEAAKASYVYNQARVDAVNNIKANQGRPKENGMSGQQAASTVDSMKNADIEKIRKAYRQGNRVDPSNFKQFM